MTKRIKTLVKEEVSYKGYSLDDVSAILKHNWTRAQLREAYKKLTGKKTKGGNRPWLELKVVYLIQAGVKYPDGEPPRVKARHDALGTVEPEADSVDHGRKAKKSKPRDPRLPEAGTVLSREFGEKTYRVRVNDSDFDLLDENGGIDQKFGSISAVGRHIARCEVNGFVFFGIQGREAA